MELTPTREDIAKARSAAFGAIEDFVSEDDSKPIRGELLEIAAAWEKLSDETKAQIEVRIDRDRADWPDIGRAIAETIEEFGSAAAHRPPNCVGLREAVVSLWKSLLARNPKAGGGSWRQGDPPYPALRFVAAGIRAIFPERYEGKHDDVLFKEVHSQLNPTIYPRKSSVSKSTPNSD